ncbi:hypothetical protein [Chitinophaga silvisoli]|uniref:Uncharacterized protein n=1 Tax=Chitinophaga silvisoli TaxID=2291814 RepID=A0A3E1NV72_9BACT|nr:hypothetical protein [Chitinophaga silvisoli]RFM31806.1 hypothetical protein DXN04_26970 [Chitinophaga silvisoli]
MKALLLTVCAVFLYCGVFSCSMFKITLQGKTMVGNNEDAWRTGSAIWFETGREGGIGGQAYNAWRWFSKCIFIVNVVVYLVLLIAGLYWHMFI